MICTKCGTRLMETDQFCPKCGARAIKEKRCPECGAILREGTKFCHECGSPVGGTGNTRRVSDETIDIPIDAIERNILSETEAEIKADRRKESAPRKASASGGTTSRSTTVKSTASKGTSAHSTSSARSTSSSRVSSQGTAVRSESGKSGAAKNTSGRSAAGRSATAKAASLKRNEEEPVVRRKSSAPIPPQKKRASYREEDWEEEDWENEDYEDEDEDEDWEDEDYEDEDWDDDDEGVDVITIMTAVVGCILLVVVAVLGFNLYKHYVPKNYGSAANQQEEGEEVEEENEEQEQEQEQGQTESSEQAIETEQGEAAYTLTVTSEKVNVRDQPSTSGTNVLKVALHGEAYPCRGSAGDGEWYEIILEDGSTGYVFQDYVSVE